MTNITPDDIRQAISKPGLTQQAVCVHASLRSFGHVVGGASSIIHAFLHEQCTLLVPSYSWSFAVPVPPNQHIARNGWNYARFAGPTAGFGRHYTLASTEIDAAMGAISAAVLAHPHHIRGNHPICSFTALGPLAPTLVAHQAPNQVYAPLLELVRHDGIVILMGVDLTSLTLIHVAEYLAGRTLFRRWANNEDGQPIAVEVGGCSAGFNNFAPHLQPFSQTVHVGASTWTILPARKTLEVAIGAIRDDPHITHCGDSTCDRCNDAVLGGPLL